MSEIDLERGTGVPLKGLRAPARELSKEEFEDQHGSAFLLLMAAELAIPRGPATTEVQLLDDDRRPGDSTASLSLLIYPLHKSNRSPGHLITIGRAANNDVIVPDLSISRFHAFVKEEDGQWPLRDAGSTNGTTVNGRNAPQQGHGEAMDLKAGDSVRLGQVELTFLDLPALLAYVAKLDR
ncbi:MAG: FHA domain-containing protein [Myxococcota bacterium]